MASITVPGTSVGLLSNPSKMPSRSYSLPAIKACPSATFGPGAICGESADKTTCYATRGAYAWAPVRAALEARFQWTIQATRDETTAVEFIETMTTAVQGEALRQERKHWQEVSEGMRPMAEFGGPVFRVHDSGDLFNPTYANLWTQVATNCPDVRFWFPTRQWKSRNLDMLAALQTLASLPNVAVRPSALFINDAPPMIPGLAAGTSASATGYNCPAHMQKNECRDCRMCWTKDVPVVYRLH